jgi:hypothetical protein
LKSNEWLINSQMNNRTSIMNNRNTVEFEYW